MSFLKFFSKINENMLVYISTVFTITLSIGWILFYIVKFLGKEFSIGIFLIYIILIFLVMMVILSILYKKIYKTLSNEGLIMNCCNNTLDNIIKLKNDSLSYFNISLIEEILEQEKNIKQSVWILTADLSLENDETIRNIMKSNMQSGKKYIYFLPDDKKFHASIKLLLNSYVEEKENIEVYYLNTKQNVFLLPKFDVVFYDPMTQNRQGYCCIGSAAENDKTLYRKMSNDEINQIINELSNIREACIGDTK